jgi:hypothetical protein
LTEFPCIFPSDQGNLTNGERFAADCQHKRGVDDKTRVRHQIGTGGRVNSRWLQVPDLNLHDCQDVLLRDRCPSQCGTDSQSLIN